MPSLIFSCILISELFEGFSLLPTPLSDRQHLGAPLPLPPFPGLEQLYLAGGRISVPLPQVFEIYCFGHKMIFRAPALESQ